VIHSYIGLHIGEHISADRKHAVGVAEMLVRAEPSLYLWITQVRVALKMMPRIVEKTGYFLVRYPLLNLPDVLNLKLVMKSRRCPAA